MHSCCKVHDHQDSSRRALNHTVNEPTKLLHLRRFRRRTSLLQATVGKIILPLGAFCAVTSSGRDLVPTSPLHKVRNDIKIYTVCTPARRSPDFESSVWVWPSKLAASHVHYIT